MAITKSLYLISRSEAYPCKCNKYPSFIPAFAFANY